MASINYFVCTLGQAPLHTQDKPFETVNDLVIHQARNKRDRKAVGFTQPQGDGSQEWSVQCLLTFSEVERASRACAHLLQQNITGNIAAGSAVAMICASTPEFLLNWLALVRMGHPVLLVAPQCAPDAVAHLCSACDAGLLLYDDANQKLARRSFECFRSGDSKERLQLSSTIPFADSIRDASNLPEDANGSLELFVGAPEISSDRVAYYFHTSGTSSGKPKPVSQTHRAAVGALPRLDGSEDATYTTTPLYHGGIPDLFRAWTSGALVWLFPGKGAPVSAENVVRSLEVCAKQAADGTAPSVSYFSAVPYVLEIMSSDTRAIEHLRELKIVGVGGAALPDRIGNRLVDNNVRLVSRYGSVECGFLLSSHRKYEVDREWQYLRADTGFENLRLETQDDGTSELIVLPDWPYLAKCNREDGSYATSDLFSPHLQILNAWKYDSRADAQLSLIIGKKFDPAPLEDALASLECLQDVLIFGSGRPYPGALLFRSQKSSNMSDSKLIETVGPTIDRLNSESATHARLARNTLIPLALQEEPLPKSSKGTVLRGKAVEMYATEIERAYGHAEIPEGEAIANEDTSNVLLHHIRSLTEEGESCDVDSDLVSFGIDSIASMRLRQAVSDLIPKYARDNLPLTIVEDCGSVNDLSRFVINQRAKNGDMPGEIAESEPDDEQQLMLDLVEQYGDFEDLADGHPCNQGEVVQTEPLESSRDVVVLTGATGALGAHVLDTLRLSTNVSKIYCLVRGADEHAASERVKKALEYRQLDKLASDDEKVIIVRVQLNREDLGLSVDAYKQIANEATVIVHIAWAVNFRWKLRNFVQDHIAGLHNLLRLALATSRPQPPGFVFCSSTASVSEHDKSVPVPAQVVNDASVASPLGYSRSKWVGEHICAKATKKTKLHGRIAIVRVGQLSGDSRTGIWNEQEAWPLLLSTVKITQCLPVLQQQPLDWLPVDLAGRAFVEMISSTADLSRHNDTREPHVYHLLNNNQSPTWKHLLQWLHTYVSFEAVEPAAWVKELDRFSASGTQHPALKLLEFWKKAYSTDGSEQSNDESEKISYDLTVTRGISSIMRDVSPVDPGYFEKLWHWIDSSITC